jgi:G3E family GTPase
MKFTVSGVADPMAIKNNWKMAPIEIRQLADISQVVTLVDSQTFGTDYMAWDVAKDRPGWTDPGNVHAGNLKVSELLAEQVEAADLLLINKIDIATKEQVQIASKVARALNEKAKLEQVAFGKVSPTQLLGAKFRHLVENSIDDNDDCTKPGCTDDSHSHSHRSHNHESTAAVAAAAPAAAPAAAATCSEPGCTDTSHSHSHSHNHDAAPASATCNDADCTDTSHSHSHHDHGSSSTHIEDLGITNFVYKSTRPFHTQRLLRLLNLWPIPTKDVLDLEFLEETVSRAAGDDGSISNPFVGVLRSKVCNAYTG